MTKKHRYLQIFLFLATVSMASGCALSVQAVNPRPNIDLPSSGKKVALQLSNSIQENFEIPSANGIMGAKFVGYRTSLQNGFAAGFEGMVGDGGNHELTLALLEAEPSFTTTAVAVNQYGAGAAAAAAAQIRYKARLIDASGNVIARSNGLVRAKNSFTNRWQAQDSVQQAMETLFEKLAADFFTKSDASH